MTDLGSLRFFIFVILSSFLLCVFLCVCVCACVCVCVCIAFPRAISHYGPCFLSLMSKNLKSVQFWLVLQIKTPILLQREYRKLKM